MHVRSEDLLLRGDFRAFAPRLRKANSNRLLFTRHFFAASAAQRPLLASMHTLLDRVLRFLAIPWHDSTSRLSEDRRRICRVNGYR